MKICGVCHRNMQYKHLPEGVALYCFGILCKGIVLKDDISSTCLYYQGKPSLGDTGHGLKGSVQFPGF